MARVSPRPVGPLLCVALLCAALASAALADGLYWWKTAAGDVEIGPTPPPGVEAVPWDPEAPSSAPAKPAEAAPKPKEAVHPRASRGGGSLRFRPTTPPPAAAAVEPDECAPHRGLARLLDNARRKVEWLEARVNELEESKLAHQASSHCEKTGVFRVCDDSRYNREEELERVRSSLADNQDALSDLEASARHGEVPRECLETGRY